MTGRREQIYGKKAPLGALTVNFPSFAPGGPSDPVATDDLIKINTNEGMYDTKTSALLSSPTVTHEPGLSTAYENSPAIFSRVSARLFDEVWEERRSCRKLARALLMYYKHSQTQEVRLP